MPAGKLSVEQWAALERAHNRQHLAELWGCSLSTMNRRVRKHWKEILPVAIQRLDAARAALQKAKQDAQHILRHHHEMSYEKLREAMNDQRNGVIAANTIPSRSYLIAMVHKKHTLEPIERHK